MFIEISLSSVFELPVLFLYPWGVHLSLVDFKSSFYKKDTRPLLSIIYVVHFPPQFIICLDREPVI